MNKTAIKNFAVWARNKLIADITYKAGLIGVSEKGIAQPLPQSSQDLQFFDIGTKDYAQVAGSDIEQRNALVRAIQEKESTSDYKTAFKAVVEEVAYTWFNRLIAIRFMEVNDYLPSRIRVLSSENPAKNEPDFVTTPFDTDMEFTAAEQDKIMQLKDENKLDELFRLLFIKQCNKLHEILPELFEETNNYTELLLSISFTDKDGIVYHLIHDIDENDFNVEKEGQVEIMGWMYQFYNIEPKAQVFSKKGNMRKEEIPAATQLFTPDWIVKYMVENSVGRLWDEGHPNEGLKTNWNYYLDEAVQESGINTQLEQIRREYHNLKPEDIKIIDPCMGSGHILVYCFDVLMQIYESQGYTQRDAAQSILENNLFGLDIDKRAAQLAYFAVMMKARQYDRRVLGRNITPNIYEISESNDINRNHLQYFGDGMVQSEASKARRQVAKILDVFTDSKEYGSLLSVDGIDWQLVSCFVEKIQQINQMTLDTIGIYETQNKLRIIIKVAFILSNKYHCVITNPPYMGTNGASPCLSKYVKDNYPDSKTDMFAVFIERCSAMTKVNYFQAMITMHAWMFLSSYEKLRMKIIGRDIITMAHLGARAFEEISGEIVQTTAFVIRNHASNGYKGLYCRLVDSTSQHAKEAAFLNGENRFPTVQTNFLKIPGCPFAYWVSDRKLSAFAAKKLNEYGKAQKGLDTCDVGRFVRAWYEVSIGNIGFEITNNSETYHHKWFPYSKGGEFRRWYGNNNDVVMWENDGEILRNLRDESGKLKSRPQNTVDYFKPLITWSAISSSKPSMRYIENSIYGGGGTAYVTNRNLKYILAFLNSVVAMDYLKAISPTLNFEAGHIMALPLVLDQESIKRIEELTDECIKISKVDWDSFETSWDFTSHPIVMAAKMPDNNGGHLISVEAAYRKWESVCERRFQKLKATEEEINRVFIKIYGLDGEITPEIDDKDIAIRKAELSRDIKSLISYAVGCLFGRYSLDEPGLVYAGGEWNNSKYNTFVPDKDNCLPITDEVYFEDDLVGQFVCWMKKAFGEENLETNLEFIAKVLGNKGATSREVIRNYFLNDFMKDHIRIFQKRPIYWLFDSGKQDGFKALVYMHRWNADTVGNLRVEYLHKMQHTYEREIVRMQETIDNSRDSREVSKATKRKDKLQKQLKETKDYDTMLAHIALSRIEIDLDDGVKVNYEKVQTSRDGKKMQLLYKI